MASLLHSLPADVAPGPPLLGNNLVFYAAFGVLLLALLLLLRWLRRRIRG